MLKEILIENFALIKNINIELESGLNIFTGETGSGKSIIVDAVSFVMGKRADRSFVRKGKSKAVIQLVFLLDDMLKKDMDAVLSKFDIQSDEDAIYVRREIFDDGRSINKINSIGVTLTALREISFFLLGIHSQNEYSDLDEENHITALDDYIFSQEDYKEYIDYKTNFQKYAASVKAIKELKKSIGFTENEAELEHLKKSAEEIKLADIKKNELENLEKKLHLANFSQKISENLNYLYQIIYSGDDNIMSNFSSVKQNLEELENTDVFLTSINKKLSNIYYELEDLRYEIRDNLDSYNIDEEEKNALQSRYDNINALIKKYAHDYQGLMDYYNTVTEKLDLFDKASASIKKLEDEKLLFKNSLIESAKALSQKRKTYAEDFKNKLVEALEEIGMKNALFEIEISKPKTYNIKGFDSVKFLISFNEGQDIMPLNKVASGGELSRLSLALKSLYLKKSSKAMIFDEIDTGISGVASEKVGKKLKEISGQNQIICITHQSQIASYGDNHYLVYKIGEDGQTYTSVKKLDMADRIEEIAKMIDGSLYSENSVKYAKEILEKNSK